jgi:hypothetical protein
VDQCGFCHEWSESITQVAAIHQSSGFSGCFPLFRACYLATIDKSDSIGNKTDTTMIDLVIKEGKDIFVARVSILAVCDLKIQVGRITLSIIEKSRLSIPSG